MLTLAAALYVGLTCAPLTGPFSNISFDAEVVFSRALTAHHIASNDTEAAKHTNTYQKKLISSICTETC
jgi:hypothetical protein